jgi:hypothetical protein
MPWPLEFNRRIPASLRIYWKKAFFRNHAKGSRILLTARPKSIEAPVMANRTAVRVKRYSMDACPAAFFGDLG